MKTLDGFSSFSFTVSLTFLVFFFSTVIYELLIVWPKCNNFFFKNSCGIKFLGLGKNPRILFLTGSGMSRCSCMDPVWDNVMMILNREWDSGFLEFPFTSFSYWVSPLRCLDKRFSFPSCRNLSHLLTPFRPYQVISTLLFYLTRDFHNIWHGNIVFALEEGFFSPSRSLT